MQHRNLFKEAVVGVITLLYSFYHSLELPDLFPRRSRKLRRDWSGSPRLGTVPMIPVPCLICYFHCLNTAVPV
jgi:hypothetical protein